MSKSQQLQFTKMHGIGNDYVYVDTRLNAEPDMGWPALAKHISDRRFGVGGDGLILIEKGISEGAHGTMRMFNNDGSESEMCGNGLRCVAKYLHDRLFKGETHLSIDTGAGLLKAEIVEKDENGNGQSVKINMGPAILEAEKIPTTGRGGGALETMNVDGNSYEYTAVSMGNPHCVIFVEDVENFPVHQIGPQIENNLKLFPKRVNIEFVEVLSKNEARQRTWERGSGETHACGTGASAVAVAGLLNQRLNEDVLIHLLGGDLNISWKGQGQDVFMSGSATHVFDGSLDLDVFQ